MLSHCHTRIRGSYQSNRFSLSFAVKFHIAHLCETQEQYEIAKASYEKLLDEDKQLDQLSVLTPEQSQQRLSNAVKSEIFKQLGWMHHVLDRPQPNTVGAQPNNSQKAIFCLQQSSQLYQTSGQSLYLLGRCLKSSGNSYDAFQAYRQSLDIAEANADIWCSIG